MLKKVIFLGTGGTIAGLAESETDNVGYKAAQVGIDRLLASSPALSRALGACVAETEQVMQVNSKDMVFALWQKLLARVLHHLARSEVQAVLITHGTDTLEETAYFLHRAIPRPLLAGKRVVLTCAMRPASSANADGPGNLCDASAVAASDVLEGVLVVCAGKVHAGLHVQKVHPYRLDPFDSGDAGPLAFVEEGRVRQHSRLPEAAWATALPDTATLLAANCPRVEIVTSHSGSTGTLVRALLSDSQQHPDDPLRGIVVAGVGNAAIHQDLEQALKQARQAGVQLLRTSRCAYGQVVCATEDNPDELPAAPTAAAKARIDMLLALIAVDSAQG